MRLETLYLFVPGICLLLPSVSLLLISTSTQMFITKSVGTETLMLSHIMCAEKYTIKTYVSESLNRKPIDNILQTRARTMCRTGLGIVATPPPPPPSRAPRTPRRVRPQRLLRFDRTPD